MNTSESAAFYGRVSEEVRRELTRFPGNESVEQILQGIFRALQKVYTDIPIENRILSKEGLSPAQDLNEAGTRAMQRWGQLLHCYLSEAYQALEKNTSKQLEAAYQTIFQGVTETLNQFHKQTIQILDQEKKRK